ncbi:methyl-accepting chemotaxis protein [Massilia sp. DD77]|uniref:methyl-accepting chemotaxis protein n=1 Tax=Massilia sp. DD77 TaxID=3109349 RepID=UPI0030003BCE
MIKTDRVRTQLRITFAFIILISFLSTAIAIWRLQVLSAETEALTQRPLAKERLISQWLLNLSVSTKRTAAVARASDPELAKAFAEESRQSSERTNGLQDKVEQLLDTEEERSQFAAAVEARKNFISQRDRVMQLKAEGLNDEALALYDRSFTGHAQRYVDGVSGLLALQQQAIDRRAQKVLDQAHGSETVLVLLCAITLAGSVAAWLLFSRSLFRRLGGEPAVAAEVAREIAAGNLQVPIALQPGDERSLLFALQRMRDSLAGIVGQVRQGTSTIGASIESMAAETQELARRTESQAAALEETTSSMNELTHAVQHSEANAEQANRLALAASTVAQQGGAMVGELVDTMGAINASSSRIVDIISVIDGIAFQTNILALNAAVEAARAGEQGRGFAVVATEVRALAQRSAAAAKEIKDLIDDSTQRVASGTELAGRAGTTMAGIVDSIGRVTGIMDEILSSSREQSSGIQQVHQAIADMDGMTQQNAALVEESATASQAMREQAAALNGLVAVFQVGQQQAGQRPVAAGARRAAATPARAVVPAAKPKAQPVAAGGWEEF